MSYLEFLDAMNETQLKELLERKSWETLKIFADKLKFLLRTYYYVGGMPEAVKSFSKDKDYQKVREIQKDLLKSYEQDFAKHAPKEIVPRIKQIWESVPTQLSKENRKFIFGLIKEGARAREYEVGLQWLLDSGMLNKVNCVTVPRLPLKSYEDPTAFKIFHLDIGLLGAMTDLDSTTLAKGNQIFTEFKGALTEQFIEQQLKIKKDLYYWSKSNSQQEVDFLVQENGEIVPIEVKAEENKKAKSLQSFLKEYPTKTAYRLSMSNYRKEEALTNIPLYAANVL